MSLCLASLANSFCLARLTVLLPGPEGPSSYIALPAWQFASCLGASAPYTFQALYLLSLYINPQSQERTHPVVNYLCLRCMTMGEALISLSPFLYTTPSFFLPKRGLIQFLSYFARAARLGGRPPYIYVSSSPPCPSSKSCRAPRKGINHPSLGYF